MKFIFLIYICYFQFCFSQENETRIEWQSTIEKTSSNNYKITLKGDPQRGFRFICGNAKYKSQFEGLLFHGKENLLKSTQSSNFKMISKPKIDSKPNKFLENSAENLKDYIKPFEISFTIKVLDKNKPVIWESYISVGTDSIRKNQHTTIWYECLCYGFKITNDKEEIYIDSYHTVSFCDPIWKKD